MTGDEMERAIEFILRNQANYEARQAEFQARQAQLQDRQAEIEAKLSAERAETDRRIRELAAAQGRTQEQLDHLSGLVVALAEDQRRSRDDIDVLVKLVGGLVEGRNGGAADA